MSRILSQRFKIGKELTHYELQEAAQFIYGRKLPRLIDPPAVVRMLGELRPLAFEFAVNRLRGFAWDHGAAPAAPPGRAADPGPQRPRPPGGFEHHPFRGR